MSVIIGNIEDTLPQFLSNKSYSAIMVLVDQHTQKHCYPAIKALLPKEHKLIKIKAGEKHKTLETCTQIWQSMTDANLDRHALMINLGGGVIGDMGGFCASTYKRGIDFIQLPTTLLSQVDASVGGKLGIDFKGFKNHIGVFNLPKTVLIEPAFLETLPYSERRSGYAEIIKHCLIQDGAKWEEIRKLDFEEVPFAELIAHSVAIKEKVVAEDPTEKGLRKILNFGHTLGHAVETYFLDIPKKRLLHGEAIAVGMIAEAYMSYQRDLISEELLQQIEAYIFSIYGSVHIKESDLKHILKHTLQDKKNKGKEVRFSLLDGVGSCTYDIVCSEKEMKAALKYYMGK